MERAQPLGGRRQAQSQLPVELGLKLAARVSTILQKQMSSMAYMPVIHRAWELKPEGLGLEDFEKLVAWAARQVNKASTTRPWHELFGQFIEQGTNNRVWETVTTAPLFDAHEKSVVSAVRAADDPQSTGEPKNKRRQARPKDKRVATVPTSPEESDDRPEPQAQAVGWGKGSVRLGPRWTTGRKRPDYYDYAVVDFDDDNK